MLSINTLLGYLFYRSANTVAIVQHSNYWHTMSTFAPIDVILPPDIYVSLGIGDTSALRFRRLVVFKEGWNISVNMMLGIEGHPPTPAERKEFLRLCKGKWILLPRKFERYEVPRTKRGLGNNLFMYFVD